MKSQHNFIYYFKELVDPVGTTTSKFVVTIELNKLAINLVISFTKARSGAPYMQSVDLLILHDPSGKVVM